MPVFGALVTAMVTPMDVDGAVDLDRAAAVARWLVSEGNEALVVAGSTGESATLTDDEKLGLIAAVVEAVDVPVIAGTVGADTAHSVNLTRAAAGLGAAGVLALGPYYNRPPQSGIVAHLSAIAEATPLPNLIDDIPMRTGRKIATETIVEVARRHPNVIGVKDAAGHPGETARLLHTLAAVRPDFEVYSGDDALTLPLLAIGAVGVVGVASHWAAPDFAEMLRRWTSGDVEGARRVNDRLIESYEFETSDATPNPIPAKAMMRALGHAVGQCRLPLGPAPEGLEAAARDVHSRLVGARG